MVKPRPSGVKASIALLACVLAGAGCSSGQETGANAADRSADSGVIEIAMLQKQADQQYFVDEAEGARAKAADLGDVEITVADLGLDANQAITELETAIAQDVDGIIIVVPDQQIGPQVIDMAEQAGIPLVAADDVIEDSNGEPAPFVGFNGTKMGEAVGEEAARLYQEAGWRAEDTRIIAAWKQDLTVCSDRVAGARSAFEAAGVEMPKIIEVGTDNTPTGAQNKTGAVVTGNQGVKNWVVWGCNDENVSGVVTALQNSGFAPDQIIGVGLGGYLACKPWAAGKETGMKAALFIDGKSVGASATEVLVAHLRDDRKLPAETIAPTEMVNPSNWQDAGLKCT
jgi:L-arabinose transport system substrate-binding protein